jgi:sensor histidine kinase YesM
MAAGEAGMDISVTAQREDGSVILQVLDTGCGLGSRVPTEMFGRGLGLSNIRDRLAHLYGNSQQFSITNRTGGGAQVTLRVPLHISNQPKQAVE